MVASTRLMILSSLLLGACAAEPRSISTTPAAPTPPASATAARKTIDPLVAVIDGQTLGFDALRAPLVELGGQTALRDAILDQRLKARLKRDGITIGAEEIERERALLLQTLVTKSDGSAGDNDRAVELLGQIRLKQGLGATRFDALLARNAGLRALVASAVKLDDDGMANTHDMLHGAKRNARFGGAFVACRCGAFRPRRANRRLHRSGRRAFTRRKRSTRWPACADLATRPELPRAPARRAFRHGRWRNIDAHA
jgi:hypothetical protein